MDIPPCTQGKHSTTDKPPQIEKKQETNSELAVKIAAASAPARKPVAAQPVAAPPPQQPEDEEDDPSVEVPDGAACKRRGCGAAYKKGSGREGESCVHHPGVPIFHEGSKGYSCCKKRVMEFDQFMQLEGCDMKDRHLFVGSGKDQEKKAAAGGEEVLETVRYAYGTPRSPDVWCAVLTLRALGTTSTRPPPPSSRPSSSRRSSRTSRRSSSAPTRSTSTS